MFKDRISALPLIAGAGLPSARAAARSCHASNYTMSVQVVDATSKHSDLKVTRHTFFSFSNISLIGQCAAVTHKFCNKRASMKAPITLNLKCVQN